ncbi:MAG TPA: hypothetical protein VE959_17875 [Bryobacteraceae bacterium]|nr:hypothetical protein [Bryobacteraceae bacterium]
MKRQTTSPGEATPAPPLAQPASNGSIDTATLELFAGWRLEDSTQNPEDIRSAEQELAEFKGAMNEARAAAGEPLLYP